MDYGQFSDDLAADTDPASDPDDDSGNLDRAEDPAPVCARCGSEIGIFLKFGFSQRFRKPRSAPPTPSGGALACGGSP